MNQRSKQFEEFRERARDILRWQVEERSIRMLPLVAVLEELALRLMIRHEDWQIQNLVHLDHASLEISAEPQFLPTVVEAVWSEDIRFDSTNAITVRVPGVEVDGIEATSAEQVALRGVSGMAAELTATAKQFEYMPGLFGDLIDAVALGVEREIIRTMALSA